MSKHMTLTERALIEKFLAFGFSFSAIAKAESFTIDHFAGSEKISFVYYKD